MSEQVFLHGGQLCPIEIYAFLSSLSMVWLFRIWYLRPVVAWIKKQWARLR